MSKLKTAGLVLFGWAGLLLTTTLYYVIIVEVIKIFT